MFSLIYYPIFAGFITGIQIVRGRTGKCRPLPFIKKRELLSRENKYPFPLHNDDMTITDAILLPDANWDKESIWKYNHVVQKSRHLLKHVVGYRSPNTVITYRNYIVKKLHLSGEESDEIIGDSCCCRQRRVVSIDDTRFPRQIEEYVCDTESSKCGGGGGDGICVQKYMTIDVLQYTGMCKKFDGIKMDKYDGFEHWERKSKTYPIFCHCVRNIS